MLIIITTLIIKVIKMIIKIMMVIIIIITMITIIITSSVLLGTRERSVKMAASDSYRLNPSQSLFHLCKSQFFSRSVSFLRIAILQKLFQKGDKYS